MKYLVYFFTIILLLGINIGLFSNFKVLGAVPNLLLLLVILASLEKNNDDYLFLAFVSGLFLDFFSGSFPGTFTLTLLLAGCLLRVFGNRILMIDANWKSIAIIMAGGILFTALFVRLFSALAFKFGWAGQFVDFERFWIKVLVELAYCLLLLYPMLLLVKLLRYVNEKLLVRQNRTI